MTWGQGDQRSVQANDPPAVAPRLFHVQQSRSDDASRSVASGLGPTDTIRAIGAAAERRLKEQLVPHDTQNAWLATEILDQFRFTQFDDLVGNVEAPLRNHGTQLDDDAASRFQSIRRDSQ